MIDNIQVTLQIIEGYDCKFCAIDPGDNIEHSICNYKCPGKGKIWAVVDEKFDTLKKIIRAIDKAQFTNIAGYLKNFQAYIELKKLVEKGY